MMFGSSTVGGPLSRAVDAVGLHTVGCGVFQVILPAAKLMNVCDVMTLPFQPWTATVEP